jgi:hypothetical protein
MLDRTRSLRGERQAHLFADSASSPGAHLECLEQKENQVTHYTVSYNKWVSALERQAGELGECAWSPIKTIRWRDGNEHQVQYARQLKAICLSLQAGWIRLADKIDNVASLLNDPPPNWGWPRQRAYVAWAGRVVHRIPDPCPAMLDEFREVQALAWATVTGT